MGARFACVVVLYFALIAVSVAGPMGRLQPGALADPGLQSALRHAVGEAGKCQTAPCPDHDCAATSELAGLVAQVEAAVKALTPYLAEARKAQRQVFAEAGKETVKAMERLDDLEQVVKWSKRASDLAELALAAASVLDFVHETTALWSKLSDKFVSAADRVAARAELARKFANDSYLLDKLSDFKGLAEIVVGYSGHEAARNETLDQVLELNSLGQDMVSAVDDFDPKEVQSMLGAVKLLARVGQSVAAIERRAKQDEIDYLRSIEPELAKHYEAAFGDLETVVALDAGLTHFFEDPLATDGIGSLAALRDALAECPCGADISVKLPKPPKDAWGPALVFYGDMVADLLTQLQPAATAYEDRSRTGSVGLLVSQPAEFEPDATIQTSVLGPYCALAGGRVEVFPSGAADEGGAMQSVPVPGNPNGFDPRFDPPEVVKLVDLTAPQDEGPYEARFFRESGERALASVPFTVKATPFRITRVEHELVEWLPGKAGRWVTLKLTYEGTPTGRLSLFVKLNSCPPNARNPCTDKDMPVSASGSKQITVEHFWFCTTVPVPNMPLSMDSELALRDAVGKQTPLVPSGADCRTLLQ